MYKCFSAGLLGSNTYVIWDKDSMEGGIIDLGNKPSAIASFCEAEGIKVKYLILTHAHYDHAEYIGEYKRIYPDARVVAHECEAMVMTDAEANVSMYFGKYSSYGIPDITVREGDILSLGENSYRVLSTPGHTPGSICLYSSAERALFTGDTLFMSGYGRCDFKGGSDIDMRKSLKRLLSMDGDIIVLPGHGAPTRISDEQSGYLL